MYAMYLLKIFYLIQKKIIYKNTYEQIGFRKNKKLEKELLFRSTLVFTEWMFTLNNMQLQDTYFG